MLQLFLHIDYYFHSISFLFLTEKKEVWMDFFFFFLGITLRHSAIKMFLWFPKTKCSSVSSRNQRLVNLVTMSYISAEEQ